MEQKNKIKTWRNKSIMLLAWICCLAYDISSHIIFIINGFSVYCNWSKLKLHYGETIFLFSMKFKIAPRLWSPITALPVEAHRPTMPASTHGSSPYSERLVCPALLNCTPRPNALHVILDMSWILVSGLVPRAVWLPNRDNFTVFFHPPKWKSTRSLFSLKAHLKVW